MNWFHIIAVTTPVAVLAIYAVALCAMVNPAGKSPSIH